ncbi:MAG: SPOR domain-containing protein [Burkholderiales bacterium]
MARNVSDEELQLKKRARRRLVGAIVLVTAVAVVLPMILDSEPKPATQSINIQIPSPEAGVLSEKPAPLKPAEKPAAAEPVSPPKAEKPEAAVVTKAEPKAETKAAPKPQSASVPAKPVTKAESSAKAKAPPATGGFVIQVAALSDAAKARELQAKITGGGLKAYTEIVQTSKGPVTRVRVGPYASREAAEKARPSLQRLQLDGKVIPR